MFLTIRRHRIVGGNCPGSYLIWIMHFTQICALFRLSIVSILLPARFLTFCLHLWQGRPRFTYLPFGTCLKNLRRKRIFSSVESSHPTVRPPPAAWHWASGRKPACVSSSCRARECRPTSTAAPSTWRGSPGRQNSPPAPRSPGSRPARPWPRAGAFCAAHPERAPPPPPGGRPGTQHRSPPAW